MSFPALNKECVVGGFVMACLSHTQGAEGFNNARRGTTFAAQTAATAAARVHIPYCYAVTPCLLLSPVRC